jgi:hypothetical protein
LTPAAAWSFHAAVVLIIAALLQAFTPFPALSWLGKTARMLVVGG